MLRMSPLNRSILTPRVMIPSRAIETLPVSSETTITNESVMWLRPRPARCLSIRFLCLRRQRKHGEHRYHRKEDAAAPEGFHLGPPSISLPRAAPRDISPVNLNRFRYPVFLQIRNRASSIFEYLTRWYDEHGRQVAIRDITKRDAARLDPNSARRARCISSDVENLVQLSKLGAERSDRARAGGHFRLIRSGWRCSAAKAPMAAGLQRGPLAS